MIYKIAIFSSPINIKSLQEFINYEINYFSKFEKKELIKFNPDIIIFNFCEFLENDFEQLNDFFSLTKKILLVKKLDTNLYINYLDSNISSIIPINLIEEQLNTACIKAIYELNLENSPKTINLKDDLAYNPKSGILHLKSSKVLLTTIQKKFFDFLLLKDNNILSYETIINNVWDEKIVSQSTLKNMVSFFNKIYPNLIINHYGTGYGLNFKQTNKELNAKIKYLETFEKFIDKIFSFTAINKQIIQLALTETLEIFQADRICLCYPIDLKLNYFFVEFFSFTEDFDPQTRERIKLEMTKEQKILMEKLLLSNKPLYLNENALAPIIMEEYVFVEQGHHPAKSVLINHLKQKSGKSWAFALHQCSFERKYDEYEILLFEKISKKILILLEMYTNIKENKEELENLEKISL